MIVIQDILYARYQAPDLDVMEAFLLDFGMKRALRTETTLFMRGDGPQPYIHVTDRGDEVRSDGFGLLAQSIDDLETLAGELNLPVEDNPEPAGGKLLRVTDPSGFHVAIVAGIDELQPSLTRRPVNYNPATDRARLGQTVHLAPGPSHVHRLGHVLLRCTHMEESLKFYTETLGFRISDSGYAGTPDNVMGHFLHCGLGQQYTDHHTIGVFKRPESKIDHSGYEVLDMDDLMMGCEHLKANAHKHQWGIGRHVEGSQIFDYWRDPFGNKIEHWTDGDLVNDDYKGASKPLTPEGLYQWGPPLPAGFYQ